MLETTNTAAPTGQQNLPIVAADPAGSSLFTVMQEQLGLRLESTRAPIEVLVIDSVEKPSEN